MKDSGAAGGVAWPEGIKRTALTRSLRRDLDQDTARRLLEKGYEPYKPSAINKAGAGREHEPDLKARWVFPSIGLSRAAKTAKEISVAGKGLNLSDLRMLTLRLSADRPAPNELDAHLENLSQAINTHVPYMKLMGWVNPVLSVPQIRVDQNGRLDPHLHALWHIPPDCIGPARAYLEQRYRGGVWIDAIPIKSLKRAAFYIASGMLDYPSVPHWPFPALEAVWKLGQRRMIRPAGWYADYLKALGGGRRRNEPSAGRMLNDGPQRHQDASGGASATGRASGGATPPEATGGLSRPSAGQPSVTSQTEPGRRAKTVRRRSQISTVRPAPPESEFYNPHATPAIDAFWVVIRLLQCRVDGGEIETFEEFCSHRSLKPLHVRKAVSQVEAHIEASLFFPGGHWSPTPAGVAFLERALPHMQGLDLLAVDLGAEAYWARQPGRREFEVRIGGKAAASGSEAESQFPDHDGPTTAE